MIDLLTARTRLDDLRAELESFPCWQTEDGRLSVVQWYLCMGWMMSWEAKVLLRAGR